MTAICIYTGLTYSKSASAKRALSSFSRSKMSMCKEDDGEKDEELSFTIIDDKADGDDIDDDGIRSPTALDNTEDDCSKSSSCCIKYGRTTWL